MIHRPVLEPQLADALLAATGSVPGKRPTATPPRPARSLRVLVVDDNEVNRHFLRTLLSQDGHTVTCANLGAEAVRLCAHQPFDLVLMDIQLPDMSGVDAAQEIRRTPAASQPIIVAATALPLERTPGVDGTLFDRTLAKPVRMEDLEDLVHQAASTGGAITRDAAGESCAPGPPRPTFNPEDALHAAGGDPQLLAELRALFVREPPAWIEEAREALQQADSARAARAMHRVHGAALHLGAAPLLEATAQAERSGTSGDLEGARAAFQLVESQYQRLLVAMQAPSSSAPGPPQPRLESDKNVHRPGR